MEVDAKRPGGGKVFSMRTRGEEGLKIGKPYGCLIWIAPNTQKYQLLTDETSTITIFTCIINYIY